MSPAIDSDQDRAQARLVCRFRDQRDDNAFAELYRLNRRRVFATCLRYLDGRAEAEDACHDVFVQAYEHFDTLRGFAFSAWVRRIAVHHCLNELRHASVVKRGVPEVERLLSQPAASAHDRVEARQQLAAVAPLVRSLSPRQRVVFLLRHVEQLGYSEIARVTGLSHNEVRSSLQNARRNFRLAWSRTRAARSRTSTVKQEIDHG